MREHVFRLTEGSFLKESLLAYMKENQLHSAVILCGVGCLKHLHIRLAEAKTFIDTDGHYEIVSLMGTLCNESCHIHISVSDIEGHTFGGHLENGNIVNTTCEVVLGELEEYHFSREYDETTGYKELKVVKL